MDGGDVETYEVVVAFNKNVGSGFRVHGVAGDSVVVV
jgi:hypothetical protein